MPRTPYGRHHLLEHSAEDTVSYKSYIKKNMRHGITTSLHSNRIVAAATPSKIILMRVRVMAMKDLPCQWILGSPKSLDRHLHNSRHCSLPSGKA
jgi:hypothetical protein